MTSGMADSDADELKERIQNLPQELQDHIFEYTIAIEPGVITIDKNYKPS
ncbi:hypothetical protein M409DRAFT_31041 [Zasmidium cellare ATCC 36951]|uniref:Uncharacterized protein n=1 Tax=Zasmidium cellare ATCC 36951 TaxID=1080233 RepID=A0A6A6BVB5_ZASCE|nr:uncharacterized protein M409DRAFT_31041 [Zasmidium cellare ATCC 36951]KAF2158463.1 hypothetical protein M409DRAFT_31041 [Zasmidium cellare ATCC 36951]